MGYTHAGHIDALNQNVAELSDNINVSFEFFHPAQRKWKRHCGIPFTV
ncbi:methylenetetrahydrofolate reductase domain protein [Vibrio anguillarum]|nr:methylenetetrahydrofolate reductase domain protein [Vibrio anguillarum]